MYLNGMSNIMEFGLEKEKPAVHIPARLPNTAPALSALTPSDTPGTPDSFSQPELSRALGPLAWF